MLWGGRREAYPEARAGAVANTPHFVRLYRAKKELLPIGLTLDFLRLRSVKVCITAMMKPALLAVLCGVGLTSLAACGSRGSSQEKATSSNTAGATNVADLSETPTTERTAPTTVARTPPPPVPTIRNTATGTVRPPPPPPPPPATPPPPTVKTPPPPTTPAAPPPPPPPTVKTPPPPPPPSGTAAKPPGGRPPGPLKVPGKKLRRSLRALGRSNPRLKSGQSIPGETALKARPSLGPGSLRARSYGAGAQPQRGLGFDVRPLLPPCWIEGIYCPWLQPGVRYHYLEGPEGARGHRQRGGGGR